MFVFLFWKSITTFFAEEDGLRVKEQTHYSGGNYQNLVTLTKLPIQTYYVVYLGDLDLIFQECSNDGGCTDDETICEYCGKHKQQSMFCCDSTWVYEQEHQCYGSQFKNNGPTFQCVRSLVTDEYKGTLF